MTDATTATAPAPRKPLYKSLYVQVLTAVVLGVVLGHFWPALGAEMKPLGDGFIKLIKMLIAPIIFCTVVHGIASMSDKQYWDNRARGMGGNITSCAEENLIGIPGTRYYGEHITVHEFSHNIMSALLVADRALYDQIEPAYAAAKKKGLYKDSRGREQYAINTVAEYFAEGTQWWFWSNIEFYDGTTGQRVQSPDDLKAYDPALYAILDKIYAGHHIPADVYYAKNLRPAER
jgi:hypothetical protein